MVRWATRRRRQTDSGSGSALGPQARGIFDRLFGSTPEPPRAPRLEALSLAIVSGKGGTGKSFLATNLAVLMHQALRRVAIVDCDFGLACDHLLLGLSPKLTLQDFVSGRVGMLDLCVESPPGPVLVPGAQGVRRMASLSDAELQRLGAGFAELAAAYDVLILDVGAGISPQNVLTMLCADHLVMVTEPEIAALTDAYAVIKCIAQLRERVAVSVVVNRVASPGMGEATYQKLAEVAQRYSGVSLTYLGEVAFDPKVTQRRLGQLPLVVTEPQDPISEAVRAVLRNLEGVTGPLAPRHVDAETGLEARFRRHRLFLT
ncbi:MAG: P-loop NTPase [Planctomycetota bacterium]